ncbi:endonuclease MutS2 [Lihuaxuella thermophila]|uniref:Endonuclease MutS2 n=1 Tax=Lihuaxuella thermophila TaxID=1173111 RepID=A0A1H8CVF8_9BACL|nr:endonuclease MutS2 [Lihuaxuella thermophila]SEM98976.1 DNA mismatch repair protein MutS2 [Lihuaxuella thermophila]
MEWTLKPLEFNQVKEMVKNQASSQLGKAKVDEITPSSSIEEVKQYLQATAEGMDLLRLKGDVPLGGIRSIGSSVRRAKIGGLLNEAELLDIASTILAGRKVKSLLRQVEEETAPLPILRGYTEQIESLEHLEREIESCIDDQGTVLDQASPPLARIRRSIGDLRQQIQHTLNQMLRNSHYLKMMQEPIITQRHDRYVIPVKQEYRAQFGGIVHDQSSSGATLFIEPESIVHLNNRLREQELAEAKEIEKILMRLTSLVAEEADHLERNLSILQEVDFIMAKARFGAMMKAVCPAISEDGTMRLKRARHPLIPPDQVVPIDVEMGERHQAIIITGPNTGGKTVTLKTIGLFALMVQSGFPIPAEEESIMPVFSGVFADIGDEQSIEQNLSTFSSHLTNIIRMLKVIDERSLVLFDELGAGTDPAEGAALAIAILEYVMERGSSVVATTHYSELKLFAHHHPRAVNASVEFDVETLRPTYRLLIGVPGRSNAFAISSRLGLPPQIIEAAKKQLSSDENRLEEMIAALTVDRKAAEEERKNAERLRNEAEELLLDLKKQMESWEEEKARLREKARLEAKSIVTSAQREAEEVLKELREWARARPQELKEHELIAVKKRLDDAVPQMQLPRKTSQRVAVAEEIKPGDEVFVHSVNQKGVVVEALGQDEFQVQVGFLKMKAHLRDLEKRSSKPETGAAKATSSIKRSTDHVPPELDLRGKMVEEAIMEIDKYLDDAILAGYKQVALIHGKGTGALRSGVQEFLRKHRSVKSFRLGSHGEGGSGVTIAELR